MGRVSGVGCGEGIGYVCGWSLVGGDVNGGGFNYSGVGVYRVRGKVVGHDEL